MGALTIRLVSDLHEDVSKGKYSDLREGEAKMILGVIEQAKEDYPDNQIIQIIEIPEKGTSGEVFYDRQDALVALGLLTNAIRTITMS